MPASIPNSLPSQRRSGVHGCHPSLVSWKQHVLLDLNVIAKCFTFPGVEQGKFPLGLSSNVSTRAAVWAVALL